MGTSVLSKAHRRKLAMFRKGAAALRRVTTVTEDLYACPLCGVLLPEEAVRIGDLTEEHAPPASMGGQPIALVCKTCNTSAGHAVDASLAHLQRWRDLHAALFRGRGTYRGTHKLLVEGGETVTAELRLGDDEAARFAIVVDRAWNNPARVDRQIAQIEDAQRSVPGGSVSLSLESRTFHLWKSQVAALKTAYMVGFAALGYSYLMQDLMPQVREQIFNPERRILEGAVLVSDRAMLDKETLWLLTSPAVALAVSFNVITAFLPLPESPPELYQLLREAVRAGGGSAALEGHPMEWPSKMPMLLDFGAGEEGAE